ncbi:MAG: chorismate mutase, partial [Gemmobacter sp.]
MKTPAECRNMAELRVEIDRLDGEIVALLAARVGYIDRAAQLKPAEGM